MENCGKCMKEGELATLKAENKSLFQAQDEMKVEIKGMAKIYDLIYELTTSVSLLAEQMTRMNSDISDVKSDIVEIKAQPVNSYNHYKKLVVGGVITTIIGAILGAFIKGIIG